MSMYRQADRILVEDEVLFIPLWYSRTLLRLVKPSVKNFKTNLLARTFFNDVVIEEH